MTFRKFQIKDTDKTINLLNLCFDSKNITRESFLWKHFDTFFENKTVAYLAENENQIVGFVCFTPIWVQVLGNKKLFWTCVVQATDPDFRRQGIVRKLTQQCELDIQNQLSDTPNYLGFSNSEGVKIDQNSKTIAYNIAGQFQKIILFPSLNLKPRYQIDKLNFEKLQGYTFCQNIGFGLLKDIAFLKWRYADNPKNNYTFWLIQDQNQPVAIAICQLRKYKVEICDILNLQQNLDTKSIIKNVLKAVQNQYWNKLVILKYLQNSILAKNLPLGWKQNLPMYLTIKSDTIDQNQQNWNVLGGDII
jgi:Acetyltransferase (GNAT) domain